MNNENKLHSGEIFKSVRVCVRLLQQPDDAPRMKAYRIGKFSGTQFIELENSSSGDDVVMMLKRTS